MDDLISVQEAAEYYGISRQAVYKKMRSSWKRYVVNHVNQLTTGSKPQKMLRSAVLTDFPVNQPVNRVDNPVNQIQPQVDKKVDNLVNQVDTPVKSAPESPETAFLQEEISFLREQLKAKDDQIKALQEIVTAAQNSLQAEQLRAAQLAARLPAHPEQPDQEAARPEPDQGEQQPTGFRAWWHNLWYGSTPKP